MGSNCPSRTTRYMRRVEAHLPSLADDGARNAFVSREIERWELRYARFISTEGCSNRIGDGIDQPSAFDFTETIAALGAVQAQFGGKQS